MKDVVAAVIRRGNTFLVCQRGEGRKRAYLWEFPGGKVEPGETPQQALKRECEEELSIRIETGAILCENVFEYPDICIRLIAIEATLSEGEPILSEHRDARWIRPEELDGYTFCPADVPITERLKKLYLSA